MHSTQKNSTGTVHVGQGLTRGAMTVFPIWTAAQAPVAYSTNGLGLVAREVAEGPSVPRLSVHNTGELPALVLPGQLFEGGWQHRMAIEGVLVNAFETHGLAVACVEQGRWGGAEGQHSRGRRASPWLRDAVRRGGDVQAGVWQRVHRHVEDEATRSRAAGREREENRTASFVQRLDHAEDERQLWADLAPLPGQTGVLIGLGGQPWNAEIFDSPEALAAQFEALLTGAAIDARLAPREATPGRRARRFLERVEKVSFTTAQPAGLATRLHAATTAVDVSVLRWNRGPHTTDLHTTLTNVRHPLAA